VGLFLFKVHICISPAKLRLYLLSLCADTDCGTELQDDYDDLLCDAIVHCPVRSGELLFVINYYDQLGEAIISSACAEWRAPNYLNAG